MPPRPPYVDRAFADDQDPAAKRRKKQADSAPPPKDINAFLKFARFGHSVYGSLYFDSENVCHNVATALRKAGFNVDSIKQLLQRKFRIVPVPNDRGVDISTDDPKWPPFLDAVYEGIGSSLFPGLMTPRSRRWYNLVNEQLQKLVEYGTLARAANDILQCGKILEKIVPEGDRVTAPDVTAYLQRCIDEKRNLFVEANVIKMGSGDFAKWLWTQYADTIKVSLPGADKQFSVKLEEEEIDGDFYLTMDDKTLYVTFQELLKGSSTLEINHIAAILTRDSTYWRDLYNMFHYATLFLQEDMAYLPFTIKIRTKEVFKL